jgi:ammonium transporter, Amt family
MKWKRTLMGIGLVGALSLLLAGPASAQEVSEDVLKLGQQVNLLWIVIGAVLVVFMQAGFALVETGFCRAKHAAHVMSTNFAIFGIGFVAFFFVGYAFMFGGYSYVLEGADFGYVSAIGGPLLKLGDWVFLWEGGFALSGIGKAGGAAVLGFFLYMVAFMDTVATIPTGAMAERW